MPRSSEDAPGEGDAASSPPGRLAAPSLIGEVISGRYRVMNLIATGGMSSVYLGQHVHMLKRVAIKVLDPKAERLPELVARFQREAIAGAHVQHPAIASATDFGQLKDGSYFLVLEYVPGATLNHVVARGPLTVQRAVAIARQIASGLGAAHSVGIVHRDVKPTNVILVEGSSDQVKLIDFGFAQVRMSKVPSLAPPPDEPATPEKMLTQAGVVLGTVAYMAPEAGLGMAAVDHRSDLYALGLILYELLAGKHPFEATEPVQLFLQQRTVPPPAIAVRSPGVAVPEALESVVQKLLEKDPKNRYQSAAEVVSALDTAMMSMAFEMVPELASLSESGGLFGTSEATPVDAPPASSPATTADSPASGAPGSPAAALVAVEPAVKTADAAAPKPEDSARPPQETVEGASAPAESGAPASTNGARPSADPFARVSQAVLGIPGVKALADALPRDGRFPPWAYVALPAVAVMFVVAMVLLSRRAAHADLAAARADEVLIETPKADAPVASAPVLRKTERPAEAPNEEGTFDAAGWRMNLRNAVRQKDWAKGAEAVLMLIRLDRDAFRDHDVENGLRSVAVALADAGGDPADKFFDALTNEMGPDGLDVLYDVARFRPWTKAGKRAIDTLRRPEVMKRASPSLKVLFEFREASCMAKRDQFSKMADAGDERALFELVSLRDAECRRRRDPCCFTENRTLATSIRSLKARLAQPAFNP